MKRLLKLIGVLLLLFVAAAITIAAVTFMGRRAVIDGQEINAVRIIAEGFSSVGIIRVDAREVALIDAGQDATGQAIKRELLRRQLEPAAVSTILLTHGHPDHIGAIAQFPNARVMALDAEVPLVEGRAAARGPLPRFFPVNPTGIKVTHMLQDGDVVMLGAMPLRVYAVPGHTAGSAAYFVDGVLFVGDSADVGSDGSLKPSPWVFSDSQAENRASLVRLEQALVRDGAKVEAIVPSHSGTASGFQPLTAFARGNE
jgi:glyoxylase-like metal-dependent hydrolase (beta-lactamase superfamily II)